MTVVEDPITASPRSVFGDPPSGRSRAAPRVTGTPGRYRDLLPGPRKESSWIHPKIWWRARNDKLVHLGDPTAGVRRRWVEATTGAADPPPAGAMFVRGHEQKDEASFLLAGDTGEGDGSQMAVVPGLLRVGQDTDFMVVCSDVIYPTGDANEYLDKFYRPYQRYPAPIYGLPGNHDWYDLLMGFMIHFCDVEQVPRWARPRFLSSPRLWLRDLLWRKGAEADPAVREAGRALRPPDERFPPQPGPYWALDTGPVRLVAIDTGIRGSLDARQGDWLLEVSASSKPKILLTGSPLYVDAAVHPCPVEGRTFTVLDVVRDRAHNYVAAIGGDIHNYQRYPVMLPDGRSIQYIVSGGGGAFMHATYRIPDVDTQPDMEGVTEEVTHLFPARGWSLSELTSKLGLRSLRLSPAEASALIGDHIGRRPVAPVPPSIQYGIRRNWRARLARKIFLERLPAPGRIFQRYVSEFLDWDRPTMYKSFLRVDVDPDKVWIRCFRATGWLEDEESPPLEDEVEIPLGSPP